jgi:hypothetical protein
MKFRVERNPAVAGLFYPKDKDKLFSVLSELVGNEEEEEKVFGVISPHAGYVYSGKIAGKVFSRVEVPEKVLIICPNHTGYGVDVSLFPYGVWNFPGFSVEIDEEINNFLLSNSDIFQLDTGAHLREHSAEVIVPFLYYKRRDVKISVICLRTLNTKILKSLGELIAKLSENFDVLLVASSDMNHYEVDDVSRKKDKKAIDKIKSLDYEGLIEIVFEENITICGIAPIYVLLFSAVKRGKKNVELVAYGNSGDVTGDYTSVVGYAGIIIKD